MAYTASFALRDKSPFKGVAERVSALLTLVGERLVDLLEAKARLQEVARLRSMSDAELALHGVTRDDIVAHVFRDKFCY